MTEPVLATLEQLVAEGKIVHYGTSVETPEMVRAFAAGASCVAAQQQFNVFGGNQETLELCQRLALAWLGAPTTRVVDAEATSGRR